MARIDVRTNPRLRQLDDVLRIDKKAAEAARDACDSLFLQLMVQHFATEGASGGAAWAPLTEPYRTYKRRVRPGRKKLRFDGPLSKSLTTRNPDHIAEVFNVSGWKIRLGTSEFKARWHQLGTAKMVARPPIQFTNDQVKQFRDRIADALRPFILQRIRAVAAASGFRRA